MFGGCTLSSNRSAIRSQTLMRNATRDGVVGALLGLLLLSGLIVSNLDVRQMLSANRELVPLLGTVVGVMITFAAIAASGEVNINAIAPGTAAALVATVFGLGVAIPCLFGYNYLNTRVKEIGVDMRVFVDEFVTRIAETYSE